MFLPEIARGVDAILRRDSVQTVSELRAQWRNPSEVLSILMSIGGDIVQKALASLAGDPYVPICFSFGWVNYAFTMIMALIGNGKLMPDPDYPCKVINLATGYVRDNKSWLLGRLLRDDEAPLMDDALSITVYDTVGMEDGHPEAGMAMPDLSIFLGYGVILLQLVLAVIPVILDRDWGIILIMGSGTCLAILTGSLPQWKVEKLACKIRSHKVVALTRGNGAQHAMVIRGNGKGLDLEDMALGEGPRSARAWQRYGLMTKKRRDAKGNFIFVDKQGQRCQTGGHPMKQTMRFRDLPADIFVTWTATGLLALCWIALLINVAALEQNTWFLALIGALGWIENIAVAGFRRKPMARGIHLRLVKHISGPTALSVLMDVGNICPQATEPLMKEFYPRGVSEDGSPVTAPTMGPGSGQEATGHGLTPDEEKMIRQDLKDSETDEKKVGPSPI
ncbi:MAG: hypothetical protein M1838_000908 [Thelocarpon superellum]|nr:MAG: hypothetical protein M1838_000908 [Thelocarpon superellum]